jgi:RNA polymerase sigma factor (sigma-70 family)
LDEITLPLVQRAVAGERAAMEQIMRALERPFYNLALRMLLSPAEAEDAAQECLLRVATRLAQFEGGSRFSTWAWKVAVNRVLELKRRPRFTLEQFSADLADGLEPEAPERPEDLVALGELKMGCSRPALIIWGTKDAGFRPPDRERFERTFPKHRTVLLETAKHFIQEDEPARIAAEIRAFLRAPLL